MFHNRVSNTCLKLISVLVLAVPVYSQIINGSITDQKNDPIIGAEVSVRSGDRILSQTSSDSDGRFSVDVPVSNSILRVTANNFSEFERSLVSIDRSVPLILVLTPRAIREEVSVSITRTETRLEETPASIVVLSKDALQTTAGQTLDDKLRQIAGFSLFRRSSSRTSNPTAQGANLRGLAGSGASRAAVMFDGVSFNDAFGGWTFWSRIPQLAVEQAEVLRGGASSFYGNSALSGAVNLISSRPNDDSSLFKFETSGGSQNTFNGSVFAAVGRNGWNIDLALESFQTAGYIPVAEAEQGSADTRANSRHNSGFLTIERKVGEKTRTFVRGNLFAERRDNGTSLTNNRTYFRQISAGADTTNYLGTFQFRAFVEKQIYYQTFSAVSADRNSEALTRLQRVPSQASGAELLWSRSFGPKNIFSGAVQVRDIRGDSDETAIVNARALSLTDSGGRQRFFSGFAQDIWRASKKLNLSFAVHFDQWKNFRAFSATRNLSSGQTTRREFADRREQSFNPRIATLYQIDDNFSFIASFSRSFRAPTLNELYRGFRVGNVVTLANENLRAEVADSFDAGLNFIGFGRRLRLRGTAFFSTISRPVVSITLSTMPSLITRQRQNVGRTRTRGLEIDAEFAATENIRFSAGYLLADSRVSDFPNDPALVGKFLPQVARQQLTFQSSWRPMSRLSISIQGRVSDSQFEDDQNTLRLRPYFSADVLGSYRMKKGFEIFAAAENIFNNRYDIGLTPVRTVAAPAFARIGLRFDLGKR